MLFSQACANFCVNSDISAKDRWVWHKQLNQSSFTGTVDSLQQSSAKHTFHSTGLRSQCERRLVCQEDHWLARELQYFGYLMLIPLWVLISLPLCGGNRTHWQVIPSSLQCNLKETLWMCWDHNQKTSSNLPPTPLVQPWQKKVKHDWFSCGKWPSNDKRYLVAFVLKAILKSLVSNLCPHSD